jgi:hypothetical protein
MELYYQRFITAGMVDSTLKLRLLLIFYRQPRLCGTVRRFSEWLCEGSWAIEEALESLVERGFLAQVADQHGPRYHLAAPGDHLAFLQWLASCDDDPYRHADVYAMVRAAEQELRFQTGAGAEQRAVSLCPVC